jgi:hypothetical protein
MASIVITKEEKVTPTFAPTTPGGNPGQIDGEVVLTVLTGDITIGPDEEGKLKEVLSGTETGIFQVEAKADVDMGEGVEPLSEVFDVIVVDARTTSLGVSFGTPVLK